MPSQPQPRQHCTVGGAAPVACSPPLCLALRGVPAACPLVACVPSFRIAGARVAARGGAMGVFARRAKARGEIVVARRVSKLLASAKDESRCALDSAQGSGGSSPHLVQARAWSSTGWRRPRQLGSLANLRQASSGRGPPTNFGRPPPSVDAWRNCAKDPSCQGRLWPPGWPTAFFGPTQGRPSLVVTSRIG